MKTFLLVITLIFFNSAWAQKFLDKSGQPLKDYDAIWEFVNKEVGSCPSPIQFARDTRKDGFSRFNGKPPKVIMAKEPTHKKFKMILAHELSHICLFSKTQGMSSQNRFRFFDEGLADIIGGRFAGGETTYRKKSFTLAKFRAQTGQISFSTVQDWKSYFGKPPKVNFDAYKVGATFIYFVIEEYGKDQLEKFFISIGKTKNLESSIKLVFNSELNEFEKKWKNYLLK